MTHGCRKSELKRSLVMYDGLKFPTDAKRQLLINESQRGYRRVRFYSILAAKSSTIFFHFSSQAGTRICCGAPMLCFSGIQTTLSSQMEND